MPAVPSLTDEYVTWCTRLFAALGRSLGLDEVPPLRERLSVALRDAFDGSQRSKIRVDFQAEPARPLSYAVTADVSTLAMAYERWIGSSDRPLFGAHADARVLSLARELEPGARVLDLGAGTGRNALALARRGLRVDAVELTPKFAESLERESGREALPIRVVARNVFEARAELGHDYALFVASELVPDFRGFPELRRLFEIAADVLAEGGALVVNLHLAVQGYTPEKAAREFAQQCYSAIFTANELEKATAGLPLELVADDSVHDYEREHLPADAWPPTAWYVNWVSGRDVYHLPADECPIELRWLVYRKRSRAPEADGTRRALQSRRLRPEPTVLRSALLRRLQRRAAASVELTLPAVPALSELYSGLCFEAFTALGREFTEEQVAEGKRLFAQAASDAFQASSRSNLAVTYEAPRGTVGRYTVTADPVPLSAAYAEWLENVPEPLFGEHPDARLMTLLELAGEAARVLDVGAGWGRNALPLARAGHAVDAVELTPELASRLDAAATGEGLPLRVLAGDIFEVRAALRPPYQIVLLSGVVSDLRGVVPLRTLFELAAEVLSSGGFLLFNAHLARDGYVPDRALREWAEQCSASIFTREELAFAAAELPFQLVSDDSCLEFERRHLPDAAFPPTEAYPEWALGTHLLALAPDESPIELRWLLFTRT